MHERTLGGAVGTWSEETDLARYGKVASAKVEKVMKERAKGTLRSGGSAKKVTSRKQAIAIGPVSYTHLTLPTKA